jgi:type I restriction enzyme, R subunit
LSELLDALIEERRKGALGYKRYLERLIAQAEQLGKRESDTAYPDWADTGARRALFDFGLPDDDLAIAIDRAVMQTKPDHWIGSRLKEKKVRRALQAALPAGYDRLDDLFDLVRARDEYR